MLKTTRKSSFQTKSKSHQLTQRKSLSVRHLTTKLKSTSTRNLIQHSSQHQQQSSSHQSKLIPTSLTSYQSSSSSTSKHIIFQPIRQFSFFETLVGDPMSEKKPTQFKSPEEIKAQREQRKEEQKKSKEAKQALQPQQQQQQQQKKPSQGGKDFTSTYNTTFPEHTIEYVDTHVHIDAILGRLNRASRNQINATNTTTTTTPPEQPKSCCGEEEPTEIATTTTTTTPETTTTTTTENNTNTTKTDNNIWTVARMNKEAHLGKFGGAVTVCCEPGSYDDVMAVLDADDSGKIFGAFGIHPHEASKWNPKLQAKFEKAMEHPKVIAWGECGLDYYYDNSPRDIQQQCFISQIQLAVKHKKPLVVHTREAEQDTVAILTKYLPKDHFVHIHCCTSSVNMVKPLLAHFPNLYVGFTGCITFKNNEQTIESVEAVPLNRLLLETDGPYMAPMPFRGAVAHSGMIPFTAIRMAEVKKVTLDVLMTQVRKNTRDIYGF